jgi:PAS domain-containing protein
VSDLKESALARRRVEDALREAEMLHRSTLDEAPAGIVRIDASGRVLYANAAFVKALGYESRQDFNTIGALRGVFVDGEEVRRVFELAGGLPSEAVIRCLRRNGDVEPLRLLIGLNREAAVTLVQPEAGLPPGT